MNSNIRASSLDALRGYAILTMVLSGSIAWGVLPGWMYHAQVGPRSNFVFDGSIYGITWVDLVFPFFLFAMGAAFPFSIGNKYRKGSSRWKIVYDSVLRGFRLTFFAIYIQHIYPWVVSSPQDIRSWLIALAGFALMFPMFMRIPFKMPEYVRLLIKIAAYFIGVIMLLNITYADGRTFSLGYSNIIILVLANMAIFGSLIYTFTINKPWIRIGEVVSKRWHNLFLCTKPRLSQARALLLPKVFVSLGIKFFVMAKLHFRPYLPNQTVLFPGRIDENIAANDPVRIVNTVVDNLNLDNFKKLYKATGRCPYHPKMMLKVIIYAYMNNIYSCRKIEKLLLRDIHYIWLSGNEHPDFITINRFRNRVKEEINTVFTQLVLVLADKGFISLDVEYIDGTKIESKANKYTFVWRKTVEKNRTKLMDKIRILLEQVDEVIAQENSMKDTPVEFTPAMLSDIVNELKEVLEHQPVTKDKEQKKVIREKKKQVRELEEYRDKLIEYDNHLDTLGERNSYSKTDPDATFMRMKEDAMRNGQTQPGYNLQIGTENQFLIDFRLFPNPTDTLTLIPFFHSFEQRYNRLPTVGVADSGYGSEENYRFMQDNGIEAFVKYNYFHKEQRPRYTPNPFHAESLHYNAGEDYYVCPMGQHMNRIGTRRDKTASGYITESARYKAQRCEGCPLCGSCFKARGNRMIEVNHRLNQYKRQARERLLSEEGIRHRGRRCIEPEAVFGQMKHNMAYKRFRHVGEDKVTMDFAFFAIAFNIKKMCTKLLKAGKRRSTHTIFIFIRPRVTQNTTNIKPYYLITEKIVA